MLQDLVNSTVDQRPEQYSRPAASVNGAQIYPTSHHLTSFIVTLLTLHGNKSTNGQEDFTTQVSMMVKTEAVKTSKLENEERRQVLKIYESSVQ